MGVYDVVHLRFFVTLLDSTNVQGLIRNLMTLLSTSLRFPATICEYVDMLMSRL